MTTKNAIEAAKITKKLKNFTLDVENFAIPQGFATALIGERSRKDNAFKYPGRNQA